MTIPILGRPKVRSKPDALLPVALTEDEAARKLELLKKVTLLAMAAHSSGIITLSGLAFITSYVLYLVAPVVSLICLPGLLLCTRSAQLKSYTWISWWIVSSTVLAAGLYCWELGLETPIILCFLIPIALSALLQRSWELAIVVFLCSFYSFGLYFCQLVLKIYQTPFSIKPEIRIIPIGVIILVILPLGVGMLVLPNKNQNRLVQLKNNKLKEVLFSLEQRYQANAEVSQRVHDFAVSLNMSSSDLASTSKQQAAIIYELNATVGELASKAGSISSLATQVNEATSLVVADNQVSEEISRAVVVQGKKGQEAVEQTQAMSSEVSIYYRQLLTTLAELSDKSTNMRNILDLLNTLSGETHLLSLNAAIEASGSGIQGARFGVVAQAVKGLATRSSTASKEIVKIVEEVEMAIQRAVQVTEKAYSKTEEMEEVAKMAGEVIITMQKISRESESQVRGIGLSVSQVNELTELIRLLTSEQTQAGQQVQYALLELKEVAEQNAISSSLLATTATDMKVVSDELV